MTPMMAKVDLNNVELTENAKEKIDAYYEWSKDWVPLRISKTITLMVPPEKCNDEYRLKFMRKMNMTDTPKPKHAKADIDIEEANRLLSEGRKKKEVAKMFGVSVVTLDKHLRDASVGGGN